MGDLLQLPSIAIDMLKRLSVGFAAIVEHSN